MEIINNIIQTTLESFDFAYCIVVNILTYLIITIITDRKKNKTISTWLKRYILIGVILAVSIIYCVVGSDVKCILNSSILAPVFWSWILKPICKKFKVDYTDINVFK